jgi:hypothetical protein
LIPKDPAKMMVYGIDPEVAGKKVESERRSKRVSLERTSDWYRTVGGKN